MNQLKRIGLGYQISGITTSPLTTHTILADSYVTNNMHYWIRMGKYIQVISTKAPRKTETQVLKMGLEKICFITAYELYYDEFKRMFPKIKVDYFIRKPVSINNLARVIKDELQQQDG